VPSDEEMAEFKRLENVRRARVDASPISQMARTFMKHATEWIDGHRSLDEDADPIVREAFRIACWDAYFIYVKLCRALSGRDSRIQALADGGRRKPSTPHPSPFRPRMRTGVRGGKEGVPGKVL